jgi:NADPH:quinone reductase-like Zn-dependent oxidoreductase
MEVGADEARQVRDVDVRPGRDAAMAEALDATTQNEAVWLSAKRGSLEIGPAPVTAPGANEIVVRNRAVAVNPVDRLLPLIGDFIAPWLAYPTVPGSDVAGEVLAVGSAVSRFKVGDRVLGHAAFLEKSRNRAAEGAFQRVTVLLEHMASPIPAGMDFADAAVLPLGLSTAACALFQPDQLALRPPATKGMATGETVLIWGGSTSVGSNAIQLAAAAGYEVFTTCSPRSFAYVQRLGAGHAFDYHSPTVIRDLIRALDGKTLAGAVAIGVGSAPACVAVAGACRGRRLVSTVSPPVSFDAAPAGFRRALWLVPTLARMLVANTSIAIQGRRLGVQTRSVWGGALVDNSLGPMIYADYLPQALADGRHVAAPPPLIVGSGIAAIPGALARLGAGVSARKIVVTL